MVLKGEEVKAIPATKICVFDAGYLHDISFKHGT